MDQLCTICGEHGHLRKKCTLCTMCYQPGHKAPKCTNDPVDESPYQKKLAAGGLKKEKAQQGASGPSSSSKTVSGTASSSKSPAPAAQMTSEPPPSFTVPYREPPSGSQENDPASEDKPSADTPRRVREEKTDEPKVKLPKPNVLKANYYSGKPHNANFNIAPPKFECKTTGGNYQPPALALKNPKDLYSDGRRPGFNDTAQAQRIRVLTNHFPVEPPEVIYRYFVKLPDWPALKGRKELRRVWVAIKQADNQETPNSRIFPMDLNWATDMDSLWSLEELNLPSGSKTFTISVQREIGGLTEDFDVMLVHDPVATLKYRDVYDLSDPHPGTITQRGQNKTELGRALNALISRFVVARDDDKDENQSYATQVGANRFFINDACHHLMNRKNETVLYANFGYFMSVRPGWSEPLLNMNTATTAFYAPVLLSELMIRLEFQFNPSKLNQVLKGKKAKICYLRSKARINQVEHQIVRITGFGRAADSQSFTRNAQDISIARYFKSELNVNLTRPDLPCVNVGANDSDKAQWIPPECLQMLPWQSAHHTIVSQYSDQMMKIACRHPTHNLNMIANNGLRHMGLDGQGGTQKDRAQFRVSQALLEIDALVLQPPKVLLKNEHGQGNRSAALAPADRSWRIPRFIEAPPLQKSRINGQDRNREFFDVINLSIDNDRADSLAEFAGTLGEAMQRTGMPFKPRTSEPRFDTKPQHVSSATFARDIEGILQRVQPNTAFVVVVVPLRSIPYFQMIKTAADCVLGLPAFVCLGKNVRWSKNLLGYCTTFSLKICTRMSGKTHTMDDRSSYGCKPEETLIMGADVTHPQPGSPSGTPSIAAVVANIDDSWMKWPGSLTIQESKKEMITDIEAMAGQRMKAWQSKHGAGARIKSIIYYRDGVSESQYDIVLKEEVHKIASAHKRIFAADGVAITAVVCVKRHNVRFYHEPKLNMDPRKNLPAGTLVEHKVTDPWRFDYYLQSHHAGIGTARSTHYVVVRNDMKMGPRQIHSLTNNLCYVWGRASKPVSLVPPAYYADILCERGRCYLRSWLYPEQFPAPSQPRPKKATGETDDAFKHRVLHYVGLHCWKQGTDRGTQITSPASPHGPWRKELDGTMFYI